MTKPLARALTDLHEVVAAGNLSLPEDVAAVMHAVGRAARSPTPQTALNRSFANLRRMRPGCFSKLRCWLAQPAVCTAASTHGAHWAWVVWRKASDAIHNGSKASDAFGMNQNGRPKSREFTRADDAAMYAAHQVRKGSPETIDELIGAAATLYGAMVDEVNKSFTWANLLSTDDLSSAVESGAEKSR